MKQGINNQERGLIQLIVIVILAIIILSLLGISVKSLIDKLPANNTLGDNFSYVWNSIKEFFNEYIADSFVNSITSIIEFLKKTF